MPKHGQLKGTSERRKAFIGHLRQTETDECIYWPWSDRRDVYVRIYIDGYKMGAHRWVYEQFHGELPHATTPGAIGPVVMHSCDNRACVNPRHLILGSQKLNIQDAVHKNRMTGGRGYDFHRKLDDRDFPTILRLKDQGVRQSVIARTFGVSDGTISQIVNGKYRRKPVTE